MKISKLAIKSVFVAAVLALTACASMGDGTVAEKRQAILDMQEQLYKTTFVFNKISLEFKKNL